MVWFDVMALEDARRATTVVLVYHYKQSYVGVSVCLRFIMASVWHALVSFMHLGWTSYVRSKIACSMSTVTHEG